jgi:hypothetical protein
MMKNQNPLCGRGKVRREVPLIKFLKLTVERETLLE